MSIRPPLQDFHTQSTPLEWENPYTPDKAEIIFPFSTFMRLPGPSQTSDTGRSLHLSWQFACKKSGGAPLPESMDRYIRPWLIRYCWFFHLTLSVLSYPPSPTSCCDPYSNPFHPIQPYCWFWVLSQCIMGLRPRLKGRPIPYQRCCSVPEQETTLGMITHAAQRTFYHNHHS